MEENQELKVKSWKQIQTCMLKLHIQVPCSYLGELMVEKKMGDEP